MKRILTLILLSAFLLAGCERKILRVVSKIDLDETLPVDKTGEFSVSRMITPSDVRGNIDVPEDATIEEVNIESMSVQVVRQPDNEATAVSISGFLQIGDEAPEVFRNFPAVLSGIDEPFVGLNSLIDTGVQRLKSKIEGYLKSLDPEPIYLTVSGDSSPTAGNRIHAEINIKISGSVTHYRCQVLPWFMGGEKCE